MTQRRIPESSPDVIEITLYFWNSESNWSSSNDQIIPIRFKLIGKSMGITRWRPHLVQHLDPLPINDSKTLKEMIKTLRNEVSLKLELNCLAITLDLLDDISEDKYDK